MASFLSLTLFLYFTAFVSTIKTQMELAPFASFDDLGKKCRSNSSLCGGIKTKGKPLKSECFMVVREKCQLIIRIETIEKLRNVILQFGVRLPAAGQANRAFMKIAFIGLSHNFLIIVFYELNSKSITIFENKAKSNTDSISVNVTKDLLLLQTQIRFEKLRLTNGGGLNMFKSNYSLGYDWGFIQTSNSSSFHTLNRTILDLVACTVAKCENFQVVYSTLSINILAWTIQFFRVTLCTAGIFFATILYVDVSRWWANKQEKKARKSKQTSKIENQNAVPVSTLSNFDLPSLPSTPSNMAKDVKTYNKDLFKALTVSGKKSLQQSPSLTSQSKLGKASMESVTVKASKSKVSQ